MIHGANKGKIHTYLSNPTLQPPLHLQFPQVQKHELLCLCLCCSLSFAHPLYDTLEVSLILSNHTHKHTFPSFLYLPDSIQISVKDPVNSVANTCLHVYIPYQILSSLLGGMYCIFICLVSSTVSSSYQMVRNCFWKETRKDKRKE